MHNTHYDDTRTHNNQTNCSSFEYKLKGEINLKSLWLGWLAPVHGQDMHQLFIIKGKDLPIAIAIAIAQPPPFT